MSAPRTIRRFSIRIFCAITTSFRRSGKTVAGETFSSPMASQVSYRKGEKALLVSSDISRLAFLEKDAEKNEFVCPDMARRYLKTVPHVRYTAVGINPALRASVADGVGKDILTKSLLCSGPWGDYEGVSPVWSAFCLRFGGKKISLSVALIRQGRWTRRKAELFFAAISTAIFDLKKIRRASPWKSLRNGAMTWGVFAKWPLLFGRKCNDGISNYSGDGNAAFGWR